MRNFWRRLSSLLALCTGSAALFACPAYGSPGVGSAAIASFSYTPPSPVHFSDTLTFQADVTDAEIKLVRVRIDGVVHHWVDLNDAGQAPDTQASDGVWTGALYWKAKMGADEQMSVAAYAYRDPASVATGRREGPPLTVLP